MSYLSRCEDWLLEKPKAEEIESTILAFENKLRSGTPSNEIACDLKETLKLLNEYGEQEFGKGLCDDEVPSAHIHSAPLSLDLRDLGDNPGEALPGAVDSLIREGLVSKGFKVNQSEKGASP